MAMRKLTTKMEDFPERFNFEEKGDTLEGYYIRTETADINGKKVPRYIVRQDDNLDYGFLGSFKLDELLGGVTPGQRVHIKYVGKIATKAGNKMKDFEVSVDDENSIDVAS